MISTAFSVVLAVVTLSCIHANRIDCPVQTSPCPLYRDGVRISGGRYFCCPLDYTIDLSGRCQCVPRRPMVTACFDDDVNCTDSTSRAQHEDGVFCCPDGYILQFSTVSREGQPIRRCRCLEPGYDTTRPVRPYYRRRYYPYPRPIPRRVSDAVQRSVDNAIQIANDAVDTFLPVYDPYYYYYR